MSVAQKTDASYLISALNILNESEINYKNARNKRLHVELALIKLCYLQQAIELTSGSELSKKKITDTVRPVAFKNITPIEITKPKQETKNIAAKPEKNEPAKLFLETTIVEEEEIKFDNQLQTKPATTVGTLSKIREQLANRHQNIVEDICQPLEEKKLKDLWQQYTVQLRQNKNSATQSFEYATLIIRDENNFDVTSNNNLEQKFIEQEKRILCEFLQKGFNNKKISFAINIRENGTVRKCSNKLSAKEISIKKLLSNTHL